MRVGTAGFIPERLTEIRQARRIPSMIALARMLGISASTVSRWEDIDGSTSPDAETLLTLANRLGVRQEYFLRPVFSENRPMFLRSLSAAYVRDIEYQRAQMRWLQEVSSIIEHYVDFPVVDIPDVLEGANYLQLRSEDLEEIALKLRRHWGMGEGPCTDVVGLMERVGFVVGGIEMGTAKLDGLCSWSPLDNRPHVLLANDKMSFYRRQMDAAHEMAHGILHRNVAFEELKKNLKFIESQAFRLAGAILLPATTYPLEARFTTLAGLLTLKQRWHVSVKAQIRRLSDLKIISDDYATHLYKLYSAKGWSREEPLDRQSSPVEPRLLRDAMNLIVEEGVRSKSDLLGLEFTISAGDVENLTGLPNGWFHSDPADIVQLKLRPPNSGEIPKAEKGEVVQFPHKK
ncbi:MAG TPA: XRE family transcriptional regulator [Patescibacteria group bacterium]|nr:XRE family transcriptional regulator [Patescibacteria group bacterium]